MTAYVDPRDSRTVPFVSAEFGNTWAVARGQAFGTHDLAPFQREWSEWLAAHDAEVAATAIERIADLIEDAPAPDRSPARHWVKWMRHMARAPRAAAIRSTVKPEVEENQVHAIRQEPPWPPYAEAPYMLSKWECTCGWGTRTFKDARSNREECDLMKAAAEDHIFLARSTVKETNR